MKNNNLQQQVDKNSSTYTSPLNNNHGQIENGINEIGNEISKKLFDASNLDIRKLKEYDKMNDQNQNQHINTFSQQSDQQIMVIGPTGSGKTTFINFLLGNKIGYINVQSQEIQQEQQQQIQQDQNLNDSNCDDLYFDSEYENEIFNLQSLKRLDVIQQNTNVGKIGHYSKSCTERVEYFYANNYKQIIIDTAGFQDSRGSELEIMNKLQLLNAFKKANKLRILVFFDYKSIGAHKGKLYREVLEITNSLFKSLKVKNFQKFYSSHCLFLFSHCPENTDKNIIIQELICLTNDLKEQKDIQGISLTQAVIKGFSQNYSFISKPQEQNVAEIWDFILKRHPIVNPCEKIQLNLSLDLESKVNNFLIKTNELIVCHIKNYFQELKKEKPELKKLSVQKQAIHILIQNFNYIFKLIKTSLIEEKFQNLFDSIYQIKIQLTDDLIDFIENKFIIHFHELKNINELYLDNKHLEQKGDQCTGDNVDNAILEHFQIIGPYEIQQLKIFKQQNTFLDEVCQLTSENSVKNQNINKIINLMKIELKEFFKELLLQKESSIIELPQDFYQQIIVLICFQNDIKQLQKYLPQSLNYLDQHFILQYSNLLKKINQEIENNCALLLKFDIKNNQCNELSTNDIQKINNNQLEIIFNNIYLCKNLLKLFKVNKIEESYKKIEQIINQFEEQIRQLMTIQIPGQIAQNLNDMEKKYLQKYYINILVFFQLLIDIGRKMPNEHNKKIIEQQKEQFLLQILNKYENLKDIIQQNKKQNTINLDKKNFLKNLQYLEKLQDIAFKIFDQKQEYSHQVEQLIKNHIQQYSFSLTGQIEQNQQLNYDTQYIIKIFKSIFQLQWVDEIYKVDYTTIAIQQVLQFVTQKVNNLQEQIDYIMQKNDVQIFKVLDIYNQSNKYKQILKINQEQNEKSQNQQSILQQDLQIIDSQLQKIENIFQKENQEIQQYAKYIQKIIDEKQKNEFNWQQIYNAYQKVLNFTQVPQLGQQYKGILNQLNQYFGNILKENISFIDNIIGQSVDNFLASIDQDKQIFEKIKISLTNILQYKQCCNQNKDQNLFQIQNYINDVQSYQTYQDNFLQFYKKLVNNYENEFLNVENTDNLTYANDILHLYSALQNISQDLQHQIKSIAPIFNQLKSAKQIFNPRFKELKNIFQTDSKFKIIKQVLLECQDILNFPEFSKDKQYLVKFIELNYEERVQDILDLIDHQRIEEFSKLDNIFYHIYQLTIFQQIIQKYFENYQWLSQNDDKIGEYLNQLFQNKLTKQLEKFLLFRQFLEMENVLSEYQQFLQKINNVLKNQELYTNCQEVLDQYKSPENIIKYCRYFQEECDQIKFYQQQIKVMDNLNYIIKLYPEKYLYIKNYIGNKFQQKLKQELNYLEKQQQKNNEEQKNQHQVLQQINQLKDSIKQIDKYIPLEFDYEQVFNKFEYNKEKIIQQILEIPEKTNYFYKQQLIQDVEVQLSEIQLKCGQQVIVYQEPSQLISNQLKNLMQQMQTDLDTSNIDQLVNNNPKKVQEIIKNLKSISLYQKIVHHVHQEVKKQYNSYNESELLKTYFRNILELSQNQKYKIGQLLIIVNEKFQKQGNDSNIKQIVEQQLIKDKIIINQNVLINWYNSALLQLNKYYRYELNNQFFDLEIENTQKFMIELQRILQSIYDEIDISFQNNTYKSFLLINELQQIDKFLQYVQSQDPQIYKINKKNQNRQNNDNKFVNQQNNQIQSLQVNGNNNLPNQKRQVLINVNEGNNMNNNQIQNNINNNSNNNYIQNYNNNLKIQASGRKDNVESDYQFFFQFCVQQLSNEQLKIKYLQKIQNIEKQFKNTFKNQNKPGLKQVSKILFNLQRMNDDQLKQKFKLIKQSINDKFKGYLTNAINSINTTNFKDLQKSLEQICFSEEILFKNNLIDDQIQKQINEHFIKFLEDFSKDFEQIILFYYEYGLKYKDDYFIQNVIRDNYIEKNQINQQIQNAFKSFMLNQEIQDNDQKVRFIKQFIDKKKHQKLIDIVILLTYLQRVTMDCPQLKQYVEITINSLLNKINKNSNSLIKLLSIQLLTYDDDTIKDDDESEDESDTNDDIRNINNNDNNNNNDDNHNNNDQNTNSKRSLIDKILQEARRRKQFQQCKLENDIDRQMRLQLFQYPVFSKLRLQDYQKKYNSIEACNVIDNFKFFINDKESQFDKEHLLGFYDNLTKNIQENKTKYFNIDEIQNYRQIVYDALDKAKQIKIKFGGEIELNQSNSRYIIDLLSKIFSVWSLQDITIEDIKNKQEIFFSPNVNQILSILIILNCHLKDNNIIQKVIKFFQKKRQKQNSIMNHVQQIKTGEGKSVIIGVLSVFFAILGFNVHSVCYSQYLSQRDEKSFKKLFQNFEVDDKIFYGTFQQQSKRLLDQNVKLQDATLDLIKNRTYKQQCQKFMEENIPTILICDEIDVFFSQDFYGKTYKQIAKLQSLEICMILKYIWQQGKERGNSQQQQKWDTIFNLVKRDNAYNSIIQQYKNFEEIIEQEVMKACYQVTKFADHTNYFVENQKIGYKLADHTKSFDISYEYLTQFAYLHAHDNDKEEMTMKSVDKALGLNIVSGRISYAEVPLKYNLIFGVTGTLEELDDEMKKILSDTYQVKLKTLTPSIFNKSNLDFETKYNFYIEPSQIEQYNRIKALTYEKCNNKQAVLIFFKDNQELQNYYKSNYLAFSKQEYNVINERTENKDDLIKISTLSEKVTLLTKEYGRGTDFLCTSKQVQEAGGIVVIQAFFSDDPSEETQIKGRTARQGEKGSYYIILDQNKLYGQFDIDQDTVNNMVRKGDGYEKLCEFRQIRLKSQIDNLQKNIQPCKKLHNLTNIYLQSIEQNDIDSAMKYLKELNEDIVIKKQTQVQISPEQHIIFLLDNSGSMRGQPWQDLMQGFKQCIQVKAESNPNHIVSVVYYDNNAYRVCTQQKILNVINKVNEINDKELHWGGTNFNAAFEECYRILDNENYSYHNYDKTIMFMTDGRAWDNYDQTLQKLIEEFGKKIKRFQCQGFGQSVQTTTLQKIADTFQQGVGIFSQAIEAEELVQQMIQFADVEAGYLG